MSAAPDITIIVPLHNDEEWVLDALSSALNQTWPSLEVICIDDASSDGTCAVVERLQDVDDRVRLYRHSKNRTAFQARKLGIEQARGSYVLFLDGDDRLSSDAVEVALSLARSNDADIVGFGVEVIANDGTHPARFEASLQPTSANLVGDEIVQGLFPIGKVAQGHLWRYLWSVDLLRTAYAGLGDELELPRANDIPVCFLGALAATRYVSTRKKLYQYHWRRGVSGLITETSSTFDFYLGAMDSIDAIGEAINSLRVGSGVTGDLEAIYDSMRLSMIQVLLRRCHETFHLDLREYCLRKLIERVGKVDSVRASAVFFPEAFQMLSEGETEALDFRERSPRVVMLTTGVLGTGGVQGVLVAQAKLLRSAGYKVIVAAHTLGESVLFLPDDVPVVQWADGNRAEKIEEYLRFCEENEVDVIIDHHILYNEYWPFYALAARAQGIPTIGWVHNFALRTLYDSSTRGSFLADRLPILANVVVLSKVDVAFWKLRGVERVTYIPNPPSPWFESNGVAQNPRSRDAGVLRLVWWGRLQQHTKRVLGLIDVAAELHRRDIRFHLTIIGPDSADATASQLRKLAEQRGLGDKVAVSGPLHGSELLDELKNADLYVSLSGIEGYPLTIIEAQALGMPVVMYDLPWLAVLEHNEGVSSVPQGDVRGLVDQIDRIGSDPSLYEQMSAASLSAAAAANGHDFVHLYKALLDGKRVDDEHSTTPTETDMRILLNLAVAFSEEGIRRAGRVERRAQSRADNLRRQIEQLRRSATEQPKAVHAASVAAAIEQPKVVHAASVPVSLRSRATAHGRRLRVAWVTLKGRIGGSTSVLGARIEDDILFLRLRRPRGKTLQSAQLYRDVNGVELAHELALTPAPDGTVLASRPVHSITKRRWKIRATLSAADATSIVDVPIHASARSLGDGALRVRFHLGETVQIYTQS